MYVKIYIQDLIVQLKYVLIIVVVMANVLMLSVNVINHFMVMTVHNKLAKMNIRTDIHEVLYNAIEKAEKSK